jgi:hypothetical protein
MDELDFYIASRLLKAIRERDLEFKEVSKMMKVPVSRVSGYASRLSRVPLSFLMMFAKIVMKKNDINYFIEDFAKFYKIVLGLTDEQRHLAELYASRVKSEHDVTHKDRSKLSPVDSILLYAQEKLKV